MAVTVAQVRERAAATAVADDSIQSLIDAAVSAVSAVAGPSGAVTERHRVRAGGPLLMLARDGAAVTGVTERAGTPAELALETDDWLLRGSLLERLATGTNPSLRWRPPVDVAVTTADDSAERDRVALELVLLDLSYQPGVSSERVGDWSQTSGMASGSYDAERDAILASLNPVAGMAY